MKFDWKKATPYIVAVCAFIALAFAYCKPLLDGNVLVQGDILVHKGMSKETVDFREKYGEEPLWLGTAFSGMPAFTTSVKYPSNIVDRLQQFVNSILPHPVRFIFLLALGFYVLLLAFRVDPWLSIAGAVAFAFSSNFMISIEAGHNSKVLAIAYMPAVVGAAVMAFNGRWIAGGILAALFGALLINSGHFQIIYYTMIVLGLVGVTYLIKGIRQRAITSFWKPAVALIVAATASVAPNYSRLYNVNAHMGETMRGGASELSSKQAASGGLDFEYALNDWSYGIDETFTLMFPFYESGSSNENISNSKTLELTGGEGALPLYKGPQRFHSPIYLGASVFFLFFLAIFLVKGYNRWWIFAAALLSVMIAWGSHFALLNKPLFEYMPLFNKFRTPTMALAIIGMAVPLFGMLALNKLMHHQKEEQTNLKALKRAAIVASSLVGLVLLIGLTGSFESAADRNIFGENYRGTPVYEAFLEDRKNLFMRGLFRTLIMMALAGGLVYFFVKRKIKAPFLIGGLAILMLVDVWTIGRRYFNDENFITKREYDQQFAPPPASQQVLRDTSLSYRVLRYTQGMYSDGMTSYWHKNILGNSSAKVQLYQDLLVLNDTTAGVLSNEIDNKLPALLRSQGSNPELLKMLMVELPVLNMLNTRYIITDDRGGVIDNALYARGNAWYVNLIEYVADADAEYEVLRRANFNPEYTAVVQEKYRDLIKVQNFRIDSADIVLTQYKPNHLIYEAYNPNPGYAVFSEVYYENGWNCYIDGQKAPIIKTNYVLRGVVMPPGKHKVEMKFEPTSYPKGEKIGKMGSLLWGFVLLGGAGWLLWSNRKRTKSA